jgi:hypothetical protein
MLPLLNTRLSMLGKLSGKRLQAEPQRLYLQRRPERLPMTLLTICGQTWRMHCTRNAVLFCSSITGATPVMWFIRLDFTCASASKNDDI